MWLQKKGYIRHRHKDRAFLIGGVIMTDTATLTYSGNYIKKDRTHRSLKEKFLAYWRENSPEIVCAFGAMCGNPVSYSQYKLLKNGVIA